MFGWPELLVIVLLAIESVLGDDWHYEFCRVADDEEWDKTQYGNEKGFRPKSKHYLEWEEMMQIYIEDSFPADEFGYSCIRMRDQCRMTNCKAEPLPSIGLFRVNQAITGHKIITETGKVVKISDSISRERETLANEQYRSSYSIHKRALSNRIVWSKQICSASEKSERIVVGKTKIYSMIHERDMPFEVSCISCSGGSSMRNAVTSFHILPDRDVFAPVDFSKRSERVGDYGYVGAGEDAFPSQTPIAALLKLLSSEKHRNQLAKKKLRGPFEADRWLGFRSREFPVAFPEPDGRVCINPSPGRIRSFAHDFLMNSMSLQCAEQIDGNLHATDVIINVDTLVEFEATLDRDAAKCELRNASSRITCYTDTTEWETARARYRLQDFGQVPMHFKGLQDADINIRVGVGFEEWSCCTSCCCSVETCGQGYAMSSHECKRLTSYRTRQAYLSFFKIDPLKPVKIPDMKGPEEKEALSMFDKYLSTTPYASSGIAVHSTLLITNERWQKIRNFLFKKFITDNKEVEVIKGSLGLYIESESCDDSEEKQDCGLLDECRQRFDATRSLVVTTTDNRALKKKGTGVGPCEDEIQITHVTLSDMETVLSVIEGESYAVWINESLSGSIRNVQWYRGGSKVDDYNDQMSCLSQRIALTSNKKGLLLLYVAKEDAKSSFIGEATMKIEGERAAFKVLVDYNEKHGEKTTKIMIGVTAIFFILISAFAIAAHSKCHRLSYMVNPAQVEYTE